jgi:hypothetical protein
MRNGNAAYNDDHKNAAEAFSVLMGISTLTEIIIKGETPRLFSS